MGFNEIFRSHPEVFEEFTRHEDWAGNVRQSVLSRTDWKDKSVLDVGAGAGRFTLPVASLAGSVAAVEPASGLVDLARTAAATRGLKNISFHQCAIEWFESDRVFDIVLSTWVLPMGQNKGTWDRIFSHVSDMLRPSGLFIAVHNWYESEFDRIRKPSASDDDHAIFQWYTGELGFEHTIIPAHMEFDSVEQMRRIMRQICDPGAAAYLRAKREPVIFSEAVLYSLRI